jgi:hypothetical protein
MSTLIGSDVLPEYYVALACQGSCDEPQYLTETQYDKQLEAAEGLITEFTCPTCGDLATLIDEEPSDELVATIIET